MKLIHLSKGFHALIDDDDYDRVSKFKWTASIESNGLKVYAVRYERDHSKPRVKAWQRIKGKRILKYRYPQTKIRLHRFIMGLGPGKHSDEVVNHINDDSLDCTKLNLEIITQAENMAKVKTWKRRGYNNLKLEDISL